jgi:hypothetical protein
MRIGSIGRHGPQGRMARRIMSAITIGAALSLASPPPAFADSAGEYTFTVLSDGNPIGRHRIAFEYEGDRVEIREVTEIEIGFAAIPLYTFEHHSRQLWRDGRAVRIDATTNDNGEQLEITVRDTGEGYVRTVNGRVDRFDRAVTVLALWNKDTFKRGEFFSAVEDKTLSAAFTYVGKERITLAGQPVPAQHYRMTGDEKHELWFDPKGHLAKVAFRRYGSTVEYVRDQIEPLPPQSSCTVVC